MTAGSTTGPVARRSGTRAVARILPALAIVALLAIPATALAGKSGGTPWIALGSVNGAGTAATITPTLGSTVTFVAGYPTNVKNPRIEVDCYQNGSLVFGMAGSVKDAFLLGGGGSVWLTNGGSANCAANLFYFGSRAGTQTYNLLATTYFDAN